MLLLQWTPTDYHLFHNSMYENHPNLFKLVFLKQIISFIWNKLLTLHDNFH